MSGFSTRTLRRPDVSLRGSSVAVAWTGDSPSPRSTVWISPASVIPWKTRYGVLSAVSMLYCAGRANPITS